MNIIMNIIMKRTMTIKMPTTMKVGFVTLFAGVACSTPFEPSVSEGVWLESDYQVSFNQACPVDSIFQDTLKLQYEFGDSSRYEDTGGFYSTSIDAIQTYRENLWGICSSRDANAMFECDVPIVLTHYDAWKETFPVEVTSAETGCIVSAEYGYSEGVFIDETTIRLVNYLEVACYTDTESYNSLRTCSGTISSLLTKQ